MKCIPLISHFYVGKLVFTEVYLFSLFLIQNIDCGYSLELPWRGGSNVYPPYTVQSRGIFTSPPTPAERGLQEKGLKF